MNEVLTKALESGLFATLFCVLFFYMLSDSHKREDKYMSVIEQLEQRLKSAIEALGLCEDIKSDCEENNRLGGNILSDTHSIRVDIKGVEKRADAIKGELEKLRSDKEKL